MIELPAGGGGLHLLSFLACSGIGLNGLRRNGPDLPRTHILMVLSPENTMEVDGTPLFVEDFMVFLSGPCHPLPIVPGSVVYRVWMKWAQKYGLSLSL